LSKEIEEIEAKSAARASRREKEQQGAADVTMDEVGAVPTVVVA
jgi:hypothetical protein